MANTKISALTSGNPAQSGDIIPIDRAGVNFSVTAGSITALAGAPTTPSLASFTYVNQGSDSARQTVAAGPIELTIPDRTLNWSGLFVAAPATPYKVTTNITGYQPGGGTASSTTFGVYFYDGTKLEGMEIVLSASSSAGLRVEKMNTVSSDNSTAKGTGNTANIVFNDVTLALLGIRTFWLQLRNDGTNIYFDYSIDGANFINYFTEAVGTFITPTKVGFGGLCVTSAAIPNSITNLLSWTLLPNATL